MRTWRAGTLRNAQASPQDALLGARIELDAAAGRYRIMKIYRGQNEEEIYRSPLTEVGVEVKEGDYILAIDGEDLTAKRKSLMKLLRNWRQPSRCN